MRDPRLSVVVAWFAVITSSTTAQAARYDLHLGRYFTSTCDDSCAQAQFKDLMIELGQITAPVFLAPAETLGLNGFAFELEGTVAPISSDQGFWRNAAEGGVELNTNEIIFLPRLHLRKGLPFSFEVGSQLSYLPESELFMLGAELKWAFNEGFYYVPDFAVRFSINHTIGTKDFELSTGGADISISKAFGIFGMLSLTPYAGYNLLFIHASSHVVLARNPDTTAAEPFLAKVFGQVSWKDNLYHRLFFGLRLTTYIFQIAGEGEITLDGLSLFSFKLGFDY